MFLTVFHLSFCNSFYADFGPLNLALLYRFCCKLNKKLKVSGFYFRVRDRLFIIICSLISLQNQIRTTSKQSDSSPNKIQNLSMEFRFHVMKKSTAFEELVQGVKVSISVLVIVVDALGRQNVLYYICFAIIY